MTSQQRIRHGFEQLRPYVAPEAHAAFRQLQHTAELDAVAADCLSRFLRDIHTDDDAPTIPDPTKPERGLRTMDAA